MNGILNRLETLLDVSIHPEVRKQGGIALLRSRMLSLSCILFILSCIAYLLMRVTFDHQSSPDIFIFHLIACHGFLFLILNRCLDNVPGMAAVHLVLFSVLIAMAIVSQAESISAPGFLWFQMLILPAFLLCGWRHGLVVSAMISLVALVTLGICLRFGFALPFDGDLQIGVRAMLLTVMVSNGMTLGLGGIYYRLQHQSERIRREQWEGVQRTARMQELLQMSRRFALKTNGPLNALGGALHTLDEFPSKDEDPRALLELLKSVQAGIQDVTAVSRSFSLFSRRHLKEGLERISINCILQHVDTIFNVGSLQPCLCWEKMTPDIVLHAQTAKLVMLITRVLRSMGSESGCRLTIKGSLQMNVLCLELRRSLTADTDETRETWTDDAMHDAEWTGDLIHQLCIDLGVELIQRREEGARILRLKLTEPPAQDPSFS